MSAHNHSNHTHSQAHSVGHYIQIWATILVLFVVSIAVSQISHNRVLVLLTAFGIATIQGILVAAFFMHLKEEKAYISYLLLSMLLALAMLYAGSMADVSHYVGNNWVATDTMQIIKEHEGKPAVDHAENAAKPAEPAH